MFYGTCLVALALGAGGCGDDPSGPDPGTAVADFYVAIEGEVLEIDAAAGVLANDGAGAGAVAQVGLITDALGVVVVADDGAFAYTPAVGAWGVDAFTYAVAAPGLPVSRAEVRIMIVPVTLELGRLLASAHGWLIDGPSGDHLGSDLVGLGDINGDGSGDLVIAAPGSDAAGPAAGRAYLVLGGPPLHDAQEVSAAAELWASAGRGALIDGEAAGDRLASAIAGGDLDGDGLGDLVLCAPHHDLGWVDAGRCYVIFGRRLVDERIDLGRIAAGDGGFAINGEGEAAWTGVAVASGADLNNDGLDDLLIGAPGLAAPERERGRAYVVFGRSSGPPVELAAVAGGVGGYAIDGEEAFERAGAAVAMVGDLDGDGLGDLAIGAPLARVGEVDQAGRVYVAFGQGQSAHVRATLFDGGATASAVGAAVAGVGDIDGDGRADLAIGAPAAKLGKATREGEVFVVFGRALVGEVDLGGLAAAGTGLWIRGEPQIYGECGLAIAGAGDVDGDGRDDLLIGAPDLDLPELEGAGRAYVVFGREGGEVELADVAAGIGGFAIDGDERDGGVGRALAAVGDVDGDAVIDLLIGAPTSGARGEASGRAALIFGFGAPIL